MTVQPTVRTRKNVPMNSTMYLFMVRGILNRFCKNVSVRLSGMQHLLPAE